MTQREIDKRTGLKGRTRQFTFPVSESKFSGDRIMFNDTGSVRLDYSLDNKKRLFCMNQLNDIRFLSSKQAITNALEQDIHFIKQFAVKVPSTIDKNVLFIVNRIIELINQKDLCSTDEMLLDRSIESLIQEVKEVFEIGYLPAREIVKESLKIA